MPTLKHERLKTAVGNIQIVRNQAAMNNKANLPRVLCLHGWLDNRASFLPMLPHLANTACVAMDFIGHGGSAHREPNALYHFIDYVRDIKLVMGALGWADCHILGHSMGGAIALLAASAYPKQIKSLTLIDILHPLTRAAEDAPEMLQKSLAQFEKWDIKREKVFPTLASAVNARLSASPFPQSRDSAKLIMKYATEVISKETSEADLAGFRLRSDARLSFRSPVAPSREQVDAFIRAANLPVLSILADQGISQRRDDIDETAAMFPDIELHKMAGRHHLHMDKPQRVSELFLAFLARQNE